MTNILKVSECLTEEHFEMDLAMYAADHMDPAVKSQLELSYQGHYDQRGRHWKVQMRAFKELLKHAAAAEEKVINLRKEVRSTAAAAMVGVPGFNVQEFVAHNDGNAPAMKSVAEATISRRKPPEPFIWQEGTCYGCGGQHKFVRYGKIICPNGDRPGVEKIAAENRREHMKLMELRQGERDYRNLQRQDDGVRRSSRHF